MLNDKTIHKTIAIATTIQNLKAHNTQYQMEMQNKTTHQYKYSVSIKTWDYQLNYSTK